MSNSQGLQAHFVGGLRRPAYVGSVTYTWPLIGLYVYPDRLEFGPGFKFMRRLSPPMKTFSPDEIELVGPTKNGVRFTFKNSERWIFSSCNVAAVTRVMAQMGVPTTREVVPARWSPPL